MTPQILIITSIIVIVIAGILITIFVMTRGRDGKILDQKKYRTEWLKIENGLNKANADTYQFAFLAADKLLDTALVDAGVAGETMDERLENARGKIGNLKTILLAHKLRDRVVRPNHKIDSGIVKRALNSYKKALKDLGAI